MPPANAYCSTSALYRRSTRGSSGYASAAPSTSAARSSGSWCRRVWGVWAEVGGGGEGNRMVFRLTHGWLGFLAALAPPSNPPSLPLSRANQTAVGASVPKQLACRPLAERSARNEAPLKSTNWPGEIWLMQEGREQWQGCMLEAARLAVQAPAGPWGRPGQRTISACTGCPGRTPAGGLASGLQQPLGPSVTTYGYLPCVAGVLQATQAVEEAHSVGNARQDLCGWVGGRDAWEARGNSGPQCQPLTSHPCHPACCSAQPTCSCLGWKLHTALV